MNCVYNTRILYYNRSWLYTRCIKIQNNLIILPNYPYICFIKYSVSSCEFSARTYYYDECSHAYRKRDTFSFILHYYLCVYICMCVRNVYTVMFDLFGQTSSSLPGGDVRSVNTRVCVFPFHQMKTYPFYQSRKRIVQLIFHSVVFHTATVVPTTMDSIYSARKKRK